MRARIGQDRVAAFFKKDRRDDITAKDASLFSLAHIKSDNYNSYAFRLQDTRNILVKTVFE